AAARDTIGMPPKVTQLSAVSSDDKNGRSATQRCPTLTGIRKALAQTQLVQTRVQPFPHNTSIAQLHLVHSHMRLRMGWTAETINKEHAHARKRQERFAGGLVNQLRRNHGQTGTPLAVAMD